MLISSKENEQSEELPERRHDALAEAFLDDLEGAGATEGKRHIGMHIDFSGGLFMASH